MIQVASSNRSASDSRLAANLRRLMARFDLTLEGVAEATGLDQRTLRSMLQEGARRPHARTLHKLAEGLGVDVDELFRAGNENGSFDFDRATNPQVTEAIESHPKLFDGWSPRDFAELYSRMAVGGELTAEGALIAATAMNERRQLLYQASVVLESSEGEVLREMISILFRRATEFE
jgi:transcriptional regulator with XRE-family HTH domain